MTVAEGVQLFEVAQLLPGLLFDPTTHTGLQGSVPRLQRTRGKSQGGAVRRVDGQDTRFPVSHGDDDGCQFDGGPADVVVFAHSSGRRFDCAATWTIARNLRRLLLLAHLYAAGKTDDRLAGPKGPDCDGTTSDRDASRTATLPMPMVGSGRDEGAISSDRGIARKVNSGEMTCAAEGGRVHVFGRSMSRPSRKVNRCQSASKPEAGRKLQEVYVIRRSGSVHDVAGKEAGVDSRQIDP